MKSKLDVAKSIDRFWCIEPVQGEAMAAVLESLPAELRAEAAGAGSRQQPEHAGAVAVIEVRGPMMKGYSSWGDNCSTVRVRQQVRAAAKDPDVASILLVFDSPGGQVSGTHDLAEDVRKADKLKPVVAYIEDQCCSAALWVASQARKVVASPAAMVGSIGCYTAIDDFTGWYAMKGVKTHLVSSGGLKGQGLEGTPVTNDLLAEAQKRVDDITVQFVAAVAGGRGMEKDSVAELATGHVWTAAEAKKLGLVDSLSDCDHVLNQLQRGAFPARAEAAGNGTITMDNAEKKGLLATIAGAVAQVLGIDAGSQPAATEATPETAATTTPEPDKALTDRIAALEADRDAASALQAKAAEKMAVEATSAFVSGAVRSGKALPAEKDTLAELYIDCLAHDGGGSLRLDADGALVKGSLTEKLEASIAARSSVKLDTTTIASDPNAKKIPADSPAKTSFADYWFGLTETGKQTAKRLAEAN